MVGFSAKKANVIFSQASRPAVWPTGTHVERILAAILRGQSVRGVKLTPFPQVISKLRMCGAVTSSIRFCGVHKEDLPFISICLFTYLLVFVSRYYLFPLFIYLFIAYYIYKLTEDYNSAWCPYETNMR